MIVRSRVDFGALGEPGQQDEDGRQPPRRRRRSLGGSTRPCRRRCRARRGRPGRSGIRRRAWRRPRTRGERARGAQRPCHRPIVVDRRSRVMGSSSSTGRDRSAPTSAVMPAASPARRGSQTGLACPDDRLSPVDDHQLVQDRADVVADGLEADAEPVRDRRVVGTLGELFEDLPFAIGQVRNGWTPSSRARAKKPTIRWATPAPKIASPPPTASIARRISS